MKTNYNKNQQRCDNCKYGRRYFGQLLCIEGADNIPPTGNYYEPRDSMGCPSIYKRNEAVYHRQFIKERSVDDDGVCDDWEHR